MDNTMYYIEVSLNKFVGFGIGYNDDFVGNQITTVLPLLAVTVSIPRKNRNEQSAYPWKWFKFRSF